MRILISYEDSYHVHSDTLERVLRGLRPDAEEAACHLSVLAEQVESFNPHLVVSCRQTTLRTTAHNHPASQDVVLTPI
jgi:hypothetical protein